MRVYLPSTLPGLASAVAAGMLDPQLSSGVAPPEPGPEFGLIPGPESGLIPGPLPGHAVTPAVREWYIEGEEEELEFSALVDAAAASLELLAGQPGAPRRRVVLALDVPDGAVTPGGPSRSSVQVTPPIGLSWVVSVHIDEEAVAEVVGAAVQALPAAIAGDEDARFLLDEAEACDLLWYDVSELEDLLG